MEYLEIAFSEIEFINESGIVFKDGYIIVFNDCVNRRYNSETCVAERDICANPPYFEFFTSGKPTRIIFNKTGLLSKAINKKDFRNLQMSIVQFGYSSFDLS